MKDFLVRIHNDEIDQDTLGKLICNDVSVSNISLSPSSVFIAEDQTKGSITSINHDDVIIELNKAANDITTEINKRCNKELSYAEQLIQTEQLARLRAYRHCLKLLE